MRKVLVLSLGLALISAMTVFGLATPIDDEKTQTPKMVTGKVTKVDETSITVEAKDPTGALNSTTFTIGQMTQKPTDLSVGSEVTIEYKEESGRKMATKITPKGP